MSVSPKISKEERAQAREFYDKVVLPARDRLLRFTALTLPGYQVKAHHRAMAEALQAVESGEIKKLMLFLPPRHGKTELSTIDKQNESLFKEKKTK